MTDNAVEGRIYGAEPATSESERKPLGSSRPSSKVKRKAKLIHQRCLGSARGCHSVFMKSFGSYSPLSFFKRSLNSGHKSEKTD
ncbi:hypothetical protein KQX54_019249 [Cotesia glomerata]|uniref:Uncharacterized protein n=1 Tax=Cotesia glomerata TaxID=32391 RepID=A0AAV7IJZ1_COTGL|nr:hypothetical protein KQX54_019249 [Cotesia glomerata]